MSGSNSMQHPTEGPIMRLDPKSENAVTNCLLDQMLTIAKQLNALYSKVSVLVVAKDTENSQSVYKYGGIGELVKHAEQGMLLLPEGKRENLSKTKVREENIGQEEEESRTQDDMDHLSRSANYSIPEINTPSAGVSSQQQPTQYLSEYSQNEPRPTLDISGIKSEPQDIKMEHLEHGDHDMESDNEEMLEETTDQDSYVPLSLNVWDDPDQALAITEGVKRPKTSSDAVPGTSTMSGDKRKQKKSNLPAILPPADFGSHDLDQDIPVYNDSDEHDDNYDPGFDVSEDNSDLIPTTIAEISGEVERSNSPKTNRKLRSSRVKKTKKQQKSTCNISKDLSIAGSSNQLQGDNTMQPFVKINCIGTLQTTAKTPTKGKSTNDKDRTRNTGTPKYRTALRPNAVKCMAGKGDAKIPNKVFKKTGIRRKTPEELSASKDPKRFVCSYTDCQYTSNNRSNWIRHRRNHEGLFLKCDLCGTKAENQNLLERHIEIKHTSKLTCDQCGLGFGSKTGLTRHVRSIHDKEINYHCEICGEGFFDRATYKCHTFRHTNSRPYKCKHCDKGFDRSSIRNIHQKRCSKGPGDRVQCEICNTVLCSSLNLQEHMAAKHTDLTFRCLCGNGYSWRRSYYRHVKTCQIALATLSSETDDDSD